MAVIGFHGTHHVRIECAACTGTAPVLINTLQVYQGSMLMESHLNSAVRRAVLSANWFVIQIAQTNEMIVI
jgi:hypothetical protein